MDEGDGVALMDPDFPEDTLPEKTANVSQVTAERGCAGNYLPVLLFYIFVPVRKLNWLTLLIN